MTGIVTAMLDFLQTALTTLGLDVLFILGFAVEAVLVIFFLVKSSLSYEASLNRSLDKLNYWLFQNKVITEENIQKFNSLMKTVAPKRFCYYWQQYILFREGTPSSYMSTENLVERPLKTSSYDSNIKNLNIISIVWAIVMAFLFVLAGANYVRDTLTVAVFSEAVFVIGVLILIDVIFTVSLRARKNAILNSIYQNLSLFGRFMDNACIDLPTYIDYQILFTPQEIEKGQPVLREFLDYKTRKEKEEFQQAQEENIEHEVYDFSSTGVNGSNVLDRAMKESERFLNKKDKLLVQISQLENELDARKKNFDNVQKDFQTKLQASRENIDSLLKQQEETTNRIESNYLRKQQTQEIAKQDQLEQEFEQQRAKYILEKNELEEQVKNLQTEIESSKKEVENIMLGEYQNFFDSFCKSVEKVVKKVFTDKIDSLKADNQAKQERITELEIKLKNTHQGEYDATPYEPAPTETAPTAQDVVPVAEEYQPAPQEEYVQEPVQETTTQETEQSTEGYYDEAGNYIYPNGSYYDVNGLFHDVDGRVYDANGNPVSDGTEDATSTEEQTPYNYEEFAPTTEQTQEEVESPAVEENEPEEEKKVIDLNSLNAFDFMTDVDMKDDIYGIAKNIVNEGDAGVVAYNSAVDNEPNEEPTEEGKPAEVTDEGLEEFSLGETEPSEGAEEPVVEEEAQEEPAGQTYEDLTEEEENPVVEETTEPEEEVEETEVAEEPEVSEEEEPVEEKPKKRPGRPRKIVEEQPKKRPGRPRKVVEEKVEEKPKGKRGRPRKVVAEPPKKGPGRPRKDPTAPKATTTTKRTGPRKKIVGKKVETLAPENQEVKRGRGRPRKETTLEELNKQIEETETKLSKMRDTINRELADAINNIDATSTTTDEDKKNEIFREIELLQNEAQKANTSGSQEQIAEINKKIEQLIEEVKRLNS